MAKDYSEFLKIFRENHGILKAADAITKGIPEYMIYAMYKAGFLVREERGLYRLSEMEAPGNSDLVQVALLIPKAVIALISALAFYQLTTQIPYHVYVMLPRGVKKPRVAYPPCEFTWESDAAYAAGAEKHILDGIPVRIYDREKTVADCFKFRNKIGQDVAIEALKDYLRQPGRDIAKLLAYARINRVEKIILPYLKAAL